MGIERDVKRVFVGVAYRVVQLFACLDKISYIQWALDSEYILCGLYKKPTIQVWSITQPEWTCKIDEGPAGIAYARWSPDSRHILTTSDFQLRLTVWSLLNTACVHVRWPKHPFKGVSFTRDGKFAAVCTRRDCKDYINLLSCDSWEIMGVFAVDTLDLADVEWSPDDSSIIVWDSLLEYKVLIYTPGGRCLLKYQAYESGLGVKSVSWSPCGQFLAIGSYDQMLRVVNRLTWKTFAEFLHLPNVRGSSCAIVFKEEDEQPQLDITGLRLSGDPYENNLGKGPKEGWYDGESIVFALLLVIFVTGTITFLAAVEAVLVLVVAYSASTIAAAGVLGVGCTPDLQSVLQGVGWGVCSQCLVVKELSVLL
ncbi:uncharacterized protein [Spinacia oleracea]|uniref:Anaphase-promoting complex subunit 4 WD40 domain-containing protein n=1 Tax=Spinacia oleracea TaxID=3562 RepID=A0ABM3QR91_SPIOL|nr:uncharacterized protein LOC130461721 [Spinacia oleracea]